MQLKIENLKHIKLVITSVIALIFCAGQLEAQEVVVPGRTGVAVGRGA